MDLKPSKEKLAATYHSKTTTVNNPYLLEVENYYQIVLVEPILIADLDEIQFRVENKKHCGKNVACARIPFYSPIEADVLLELIISYNIRLDPPVIETIEDALYVLSLDESLPLKSVKNCLEILIGGDFVDLHKKKYRRSLRL